MLDAVYIQARDCLFLSTARRSPGPELSTMFGIECQCPESLIVQARMLPIL